MFKPLSSPFVVLALAAGMLAAGCKSSGQEPTGNPAGPSGAATSGKPTGMLAIGAVAPDVSMKLQDGSEVKLSSLKGKHVVLYFYPKDDTPGCRIEAQSFRDSHEALNKADIKVFGLSTQDAVSHQAFIDKESLNFPLVVDDGTIAMAFGVPLTLGFASRQTFLIGPDGVIKKIWRNVKPSGHAEDVLAAVGG